MPQVSLYIDEETLKRIEIAAKTEHLSLSKYVSLKLRGSLADQWPERYGELFGSITDTSFAAEPPGAEDTPREPL
jgi:hypothetical protein